VFGLGFEDDEIAEGSKRLVFNGGQPAVLRFASFEFGDFVHYVLPCSLGGDGIARFPIDARQMQTERRRVFVFILSRN
jgi:hypothetical protein